MGWFLKAWGDWVKAVPERSFGLSIPLLPGLVVSTGDGLLRATEMGVLSKKEPKKSENVFLL